MQREVERPASGTVERWCWDLIQATDWEAKATPRPPPDPGLATSWEEAAPPRRLSAAGRPDGYRVEDRSRKTPRSLVRPEARARLLHTFLHHELQAAELFAWAVLAFPETPRRFRRGLVHLCLEELAHFRLYARALERLGSKPGDFGARDWFWQRVAASESALAFVSLLGLGFEGANLDHSALFAGRFREVGDESSARLLEHIEAEEIRHVHFARRWFLRFSGESLRFERWRRELPAPLTPTVLQGRPINREARLRAGYDEPFLEDLGRSAKVPEVRR